MKVFVSMKYFLDFLIAKLSKMAITNERNERNEPY